ncbi:hypothetical protein ACFQ2B_39640 [Streptomyces stramineus]
MTLSEDRLSPSVTPPAATAHALVHDFSSFVAGEAVRNEDAWTYSIRATALIDDPLGATAYKRSLDRGTMGVDAYPDVVLGRCALARPELMEEALRAAAQAAPPGHECRSSSG